MENIIEKAREVMNVEIDGIIAVRDGLNQNFETMAQWCLDTVNKGAKLIVSGIGKSGYIGKKMAATLSSVGTTAVFLHPVEACHGDLGIIQNNDLLIALSYSGETAELLGVLAPAKALGVKIIAITASAKSTLGKASDLTVEMPVPKEACPFGLAPTTSTTALLALGDALAVVMMHLREFSKISYGKLHPGGAIGRTLTLRVEDLMRSHERSACVSPDCTVRETMLKMTEVRSGSAIVVDSTRHLLGIFTDGDLRRCIEKDDSVLSRRVGEVMTVNPIVVRSKAMAGEALAVFENRKIDDLVVVDDDNVVQGFIDVQDLPGLKLM